jgi:hypothetical protein
MSNFNEEVCEYNSTPVNENFAPNRRGVGNVFHRSTDCPDPYQVKLYPNGGFYGEGYCVNMSDDMLKIIDSYDYNWTIEEINAELSKKI